MKKNKLITIMLTGLILIGGVAIVKTNHAYSCNNEDEGWSYVVQFLA